MKRIINIFLIFILFSCTLVTPKKIETDRNIIYQNVINYIQQKYDEKIDKSIIQIYRTRKHWNANVYLPVRVINIIMDDDANILEGY